MGNGTHAGGFNLSYLVYFLTAFHLPFLPAVPLRAWLSMHISPHPNGDVLICMEKVPTGHFFAHALRGPPFRVPSAVAASLLRQPPSVSII